MTAKEKERIFVERIQREQPYNWRKYCELIDHENMSVDELHEYNFRQRLELLKFAFERTSFYRQFYLSHGVRPEDVKTEEDWARLPIVTKDTLRTHCAEMCIDNGQSDEFKRNSKLFTSGGSTGKPVKFFVDKAENGSGAPFNEWRAMGWWLGRERGTLSGGGAVLGQNEAWILRLQMFKLLRSPAVRAEMSRMYAPTMRFYLDVNDMDAEKVAEFVRQANEHGVDYIAGYTGAVEEVARYFLNGRLERKFTPRAIHVRSTPLSSVARRTIEEGFGCLVYDLYGSNETYFLSFENPASQAHNLIVSSDLRHIDIVDEDGINVAEGTEGSVCVTDFMNHVMPLIRYSLGDRACLVAHETELPFPCMSPVKGRASDYLEMKDGGRLFGLCEAFNQVPDCVYAYQFVQHSPGKVTVRVVPNSCYPHWRAEVDAVLSGLRRDAAGRIEYRLEFLESIPHNAGKIRFIVYE